MPSRIRRNSNLVIAAGYWFVSRPVLILAMMIFAGKSSHAGQRTATEPILTEGGRAQVGEPVPMAPRHSPISLFNGRNLDGFYSWLMDSKKADPRGVFTVTNGLLRISGDGLGYLRTRQSYRDYILRLEFRWGQTNWSWGDRVGKARDSGVFLHSFGPDGNSHDGRGAFKAAIECNIFQGATGDFLLIRGSDAEGRPLHPRISVRAAPERDADGWPTWDPEGASTTLERWGRVNWRLKSTQWLDQTDFRGRHDVEKPYGEWNLLECRCDGDRIEIKLNGVKVNEATRVYPQSGPILLQCEGSEIFFRNITLHSLK